MEVRHEIRAGATRSSAGFHIAYEELTEAKLEVADKTEERIALLEEQLKVAQEVLDFHKNAFEAGFQSTGVEISQAKAYLLRVEIGLLTEKKSDDSSKLEQLRKERLEALGKVVELVTIQFEHGAGLGKELTAVFIAREELIKAKLESAEKPEERIALLKEQLKGTQEVFDFVEKQHEAGFRVTDLEYNQAKAHCLGIRIKIAKEEAKTVKSL